VTLGVFIQYFIIKLAIKNAIKESSGEIKRIIEKAVTTSLEQQQWKQDNI
jgi:hypothetical protein